MFFFLFSQGPDNFDVLFMDGYLYARRTQPAAITPAIITLVRLQSKDVYQSSMIIIIHVNDRSVRIMKSGK